MHERPQNVDAATLAACLALVPSPIFAAAWTRRSVGDTLFVHLAATPNRSAVRRQIAADLRALGVAHTRVRFHNAAQLHAPRSLEQLVARFAGDEIVYDPTGAVARANALVATGQAVRTALADKLFGLYYAPRQRTFFVVLKSAAFAAGEKIKVGALADVERAVALAMSSSFGAALDDCPAVRVGFGLPQINLVAIDRRSIGGWGVRVAAVLRRHWKPVTLAALFGFGMTGSAAAREPAVSETNLKVTAQTGEVSGDGAWVFGGALTAPLGQYTGLQLEAGIGGADGDTAWGGAAHVFTRDPDKYLLGLFAAVGKESDFNVDVERLGAEAEIYMNQVTILAKAGYQFSDKIGDTAFGNIDLRWYATDNFAITGGASFAEHSTTGSLGIEFMPGFSALPGLAFNVKGSIGNDDFDSILGGVTYYFGSNASLRDRQRKQDPDAALFDLFQSVQTERARLQAIYGSIHH